MANVMSNYAKSPCACATAFSARRHNIIAGIALAVSVSSIFGGLLVCLISILLTVLCLLEPYS